MSFLLKSIKATNFTCLLLFIGCCYYKLHVQSEKTPPGHQGALTVVDVQEDNDANGVVSVEDNDGEEEHEPLEVFYPTKEWKTIKPGQAVPSGLHVRMNFQTGENEAKLMEDDSGIKYWQSGERKGMVNTDKKQFSRDELKKALKDFKSEQSDGQEPEKAKKIREKFRSYKDLKEDFMKINMAIKTEAEIVTELVEKFRMAGTTITSKKAVLSDLEFYLHQIDNGRLFCDLGGMQLLVSTLNDTLEDLRSEAAFVLGSAMQSNPKVQISAIEYGAMQQLIRMISVETSLPLHKKIMYAMSSLLRHFPFAQKRFLELGGLSAFEKLFEQTGVGAEKLQIRAVTLLNDLLLEKELNQKHNDKENKVEKERLKQYNDVHLLETMQKSGWCDLIPKLLHLTEHDSREKVLTAMVTLTPTCKTSFAHVRHTLDKLRNEYEKLTQEESDAEDEFFSGLLNSLNIMLKSLPIKDEL